jgi:hypothetical protein
VDYLRKLLLGKTVVMNPPATDSFYCVSRPHKKAKKQPIVVYAPLPSEYLSQEAVVQSIDTQDLGKLLGIASLPAAPPSLLAVLITLSFPDGSLWQTETIAGAVADQENLSPIILKGLRKARTSEATPHVLGSLGRRIYLIDGASPRVYGPNANFEDLIKGDSNQLYPLLVAYSISKAEYSPISNLIRFSLSTSEDTFFDQLTLFEKYPSNCQTGVIDCLLTTGGDFALEVPSDLSKIEVAAMRHHIVIKGMSKSVAHMVLGEPQHSNLLDDTEQMIYRDGKLIVYVENDMVTHVQMFVP